MKRRDFLPPEFQNLYSNALIMNRPGITTGIPPSFSTNSSIMPGIVSGIPHPSPSKRLPSNPSHCQAFGGYPSCSSPPLGLPLAHSATFSQACSFPISSSCPSSSSSSPSTTPGIISGIPPHNNNNINNNNPWPKHRERKRKTGLPTVLENNWHVSPPAEAADCTTVGNYDRP